MSVIESMSLGLIPLVTKLGKYHFIVSMEKIL